MSTSEIEIDEMAQVVSRDPILATQLLKIVNSPVCGLLKTISSIRDAVAYMGLIQIRKWIIMMSMLNETTGSLGAIHLVLTRAKACENYAAATLQLKSDQAFLVGLLSGVHLLFGINSKLFLQQVSLQSKIEKAILEEDGLLGGILYEIKQVEYATRQNSAVELNREGPELLAYHEASERAKTVLMTTSNN